jgi:starch phosphorylase
MKYIGRFARELGLSRDELLGLGREDPHDRREEFCMTVLALKLARHCNGVAALHGETSRRMWMKVFGAKRPQDVPIGHVTNGVHPQTWLAPETRPIYDRYIKPDWRGAIWKANPWRRATKIPPAELWAARNMLRARMIQFVRERLVGQILRRGGAVEELIVAHQTLDPRALTIGFARRFATYKRAPLIFRDARRLASIVGNKDRPVQLIFAGKAHPKDLGGQEFARVIYRHARIPAFCGRVVLLEDYDMNVGRMLTSGCDVWLNNPLRPQEASGTSGMKPPLHGGLNCSILDGWWPEAFNDRNGWAIGGKQFADQKKQDSYDADSIYALLERKIVPAFYSRDRGGVPRKWTAMMAGSMKTVCAQFSSQRMLAEYLRGYYLPAHRAGGSGSATSHRQ